MLVYHVATSFHSTITYANTCSFYRHYRYSLCSSTKDIYALLQGVVSRMDMLSEQFEKLELRFDKVGIYTLPQDVPSRIHTTDR
jgi:hypothetical protein